MSIASTFGTPTSYYGPHNTVVCPDCRQRADADWGDHGGDCLDTVVFTLPGTALGLIRRHAETHLRFSADDLADTFKAKDIATHSRGPAFGEAKRRGWIETESYAPSSAPRTKRHPIAHYRSLIYRPAAGRAAS